jgi:hypothetical protein
MTQFEGPRLGRTLALWLRYFHKRVVMVGLSCLRQSRRSISSPAATADTRLDSHNATQQVALIAAIRPTGGVQSGIRRHQAYYQRRVSGLSICRSKVLTVPLSPYFMRAASESLGTANAFSFKSARKFPTNCRQIWCVVIDGMTENPRMLAIFHI